MKGKKLIALAIAAVALVGLAVLTQKRNQHSAPSMRGKPVLTDFDVNAVARIVVGSSSGTTTVARVDGVWVSTDKHGYPADFSKIRKAVLGLSELKVGQVVAALSDEQRQSLKMLSPGVSTDDAGTLVELYAKDDTPLASLLLGAEHMRQVADQPGPMGGGYPDGRYVSPDGGQSVYLVAETLSYISVQSREWLDTEIVNVSGDDVAALSVDAPGAGPLVFKKDGSDLVLEGLGEDEEMDSSKSWTLKSGLSYLRFDDVADPSMGDEACGFTNAAAYTVTTGDGEIYKALVGGSPASGDGRYLRLSAELTPADPVASAGDDETDEEKAARKKAEQERAGKQAKIDEFNERLKEWTFVIPKHKADSLLLSRDDVVTEKETEDETDAEDESSDDTEGDAAAE